MQQIKNFQSIVMSRLRIFIRLFQNKKLFWWAIGAGIAIFIVVIASGSYVAYNRYFKAKSEDKKPNTVIDFKNNIGSLVQVQSAGAQNFAVFQSEKLNVAPKVDSYEIDQDLENIENKKQFDYLISGGTEELLLKNGFAAAPGEFQEFFSLYEDNRGNYIPSFITADSVLHNFHLLFDYSFKKLEEEKLIQALRELNVGMLAASEAQHKTLKNTDWENAAWRNIAFFTIANKLLEPAAPIDPAVSDIAREELALIEKHEGIKSSPLVNSKQENGDYLEDYSQYIPRGHYTQSEALQRYFKTMIWYGRITFRQKSEDETRSAILAVLALGQREANFTNWEKIYESTNFFAGKSDDITFYQYLEILERVYGADVNLESLLNPDNLIIFSGQARELDPLALNSMPIFGQADREKEIKGFRLMGQRFGIDAGIFQRLICPEVGNRRGAADCGGGVADSRTLPQGLDLPAAMGSEEAYNILKTAGEDKYFQYSENMRKTREYLAGLDVQTWTQNLSWGWLYSLKPMLEARGEGYPAFMQNQAWQAKNLNSYLGSWTELKHDPALYAKQDYSDLGAGGPIEKQDDRGYVEPEPEVYSRMASLVRMLREGLILRELLSESQGEMITKLETITDRLKTISVKELENKDLSEEDYDFIRSYGGQLKDLRLSLAQDEEAGDASENPAALVSDVAADPNGQGLQEANGNIFNLYVIVPVEGRLRIARGAIYSHYEFKQPLSNRLTDAEWQKILSGESKQKMPSLPKWTESFAVDKK